MAKSTSLSDAPQPGYVYFLTAIAALGGLLFGYDTAVIAGAIGAVNKTFQLGAAEGTWYAVFWEGWAVGSAIIGCVIGVFFAGTLSDRYGRRNGLIAAALLLLISAVATALPRTFTEFILARMIGGVGVGIASMLSPVYIAEISPPAIRGRLVAINQLAIITGMLVTSSVNFLLQQSLGSAEAAWRWMFASEAIPATAFLLALFLVPESPRWLIQKGKLDLALSILTRIGGRQHASEEMAEIKDAVSHEPTRFRDLFRPGMQKALLIGIVLAIFTQITGINTILYYTTEILKTAGESQTQAFLKTAFLNGINVVFTILAVLTIDRLGRRNILLIAMAGMAVFLGGLGVTFHYPELGTTISFLMLICYVVCFMYGLGPGFWTLVSEIYPTKMRGRCLSVVTVFLWLSTYFVSQTYPLMLKAVGPAFTFWTYGLMSLLGFFFVLAFVPETKGKTLEAIEQQWLK